MNDDLKKEILNLIKEKPLNYGLCCLSKNYLNLKRRILNATPLLNETFNFKTRIFLDIK